MNIVKTWQSGFNGDGVTICINDNGVDITHPEFKGRFVSFLIVLVDISH